MEMSCKLLESKRFVPWCLAISNKIIVIFVCGKTVISTNGALVK